MGLREFCDDLWANWAVDDDRGRVFLFPLVVLAWLSAIAVYLEHVHTLHYVPTAICAVACVVIASRICVRAGLWALFLMIAFHYAGDYVNGLSPTADFIEDGAVFVGTLVGVLLVAPRRPPARPPRGIADTDPLPFTSSSDENGTPRMCLWDVDPTWKWPEDDPVGLEYGRLYDDRALRNLPRPLLALIVRDMMYEAVRRAADGRPVWTGIEAGFFCHIGRALQRRLSLPDDRANNGGPHAGIIGANR